MHRLMLEDEKKQIEEDADKWWESLDWSTKDSIVTFLADMASGEDMTKAFKIRQEEAEAKAEASFAGQQAAFKEHREHVRNLNHGRS
jgi:hypothetical protein